MDRSTARRARIRTWRTGGSPAGPAATAALGLVAFVLAGPAPAQLSGSGSQLWHQDATGIVNSVEDLDAFGAALAAGDFNGDGRADLAVGVPGETVGAAANAGAVHLLLAGETGGLGAAGNRLFHQEVPGIPGVAEPNDFFGWALAVGDFDGDGFDDLAVGVPFETVSAPDDGAVHVLHGSDTDTLLRTVGSQLWSQGSPGVSGDSETWDQFGFSLAAGDFDGDGFDDLAIGVVGETFESDWPFTFDPVGQSHGRVVVLHGSPVGLTADRERDWHQDSWDGGVGQIDGEAEAGDAFGEALAAGDFDGDGFDDLAVGAPGENDDKGVVNLIYGSDAGLGFARNRIWEQGADGIEGVREIGDFFGASLVAGDFDGDRFDDLAVGAPDEDVGSGAAAQVDAGSVSVLYGSEAGIAAAGNQLWHQDVAGVLEVAGAGDHFGAALAVCDGNRDGIDDLAIGVPGEVLASGQRAGAAQVLYGTDFGLLVFGNQVWHQDASGVTGDGQAGDELGAALAGGDFEGAGVAAGLAIGLPGEDFGTAPVDGGVVLVLYGEP
jgi:hypothetical protein